MRHRVFAQECFRRMGAEAESTDAVTKAKDRRGRLSHLIPGFRPTPAARTNSLAYLLLCAGTGAPRRRPRRDGRS